MADRLIVRDCSGHSDCQICSDKNYWLEEFGQVAYSAFQAVYIPMPHVTEIESRLEVFCRPVGNVEP